MVEQVYYCMSKKSFPFFNSFLIKFTRFHGHTVKDNSIKKNMLYEKYVENKNFSKY